jgi:hypothetical protein
MSLLEEQLLLDENAGPLAGEGLYAPPWRLHEIRRRAAGHVSGAAGAKGRAGPGRGEAGEDVGAEGEGTETEAEGKEMRGELEGPAPPSRSYRGEEVFNP